MCCWLYWTKEKKLGLDKPVRFLENLIIHRDRSQSTILLMDLSIIKANLNFRTELTGMASADWGPRIELGCLAFSGSLMLINTIQPIRYDMRYYDIYGCDHMVKKVPYQWLLHLESLCWLALKIELMIYVIAPVGVRQCCQPRKILDLSWAG